MSGRCRRHAQLLSPVLLLLLFASLLASGSQPASVDLGSVDVSSNSTDDPSQPNATCSLFGSSHGAEWSQLCCHWNDTSLAAFCLQGEPSAAREALVELSNGRHRVPLCDQFQLDWVLPQFPGCEGLAAALEVAGEVGGNFTAVEAAQDLTRHCLGRVVSRSAGVSQILDQFRDLIGRLFSRWADTKLCQGFYKDWLCTVRFSVHCDSSDPASLVRPCPEWCQAVETECPYLTPMNETNSGEPVFLCHEDSYKGSGRSDRCTDAKCCCYKADRTAATNRSSVSVGCTSQLSRRIVTTGMVCAAPDEVAAYNVTDSAGASVALQLPLPSMLMFLCCVRRVSLLN